MQVKSYQAATLAEAFAQVKAQLGEDAVILSNQTVNENGRTLCRVMAAVDPEGRAADAEAAKPAAGPARRDDFLDEAAGASMGQWEREWCLIKGHLQALMRPQMDMQALAPRQRLALEYLEREGVDTGALATVYRELAQDADLSVLPVLERIAPVRPFGPETWPQKFHAFAGPHGMGKTSTLLRLAMAEKKQAPKKKICIACAGDSQGRGRLVLRHYAELSGLAYRELAQAGDFVALVKESSGFDRVFIDLPGLTGAGTLQQWLESMGMDAGDDMAVHLVLAPYFCPQQYQAFAEQYASGKLKSIVWTKLDEACTFGAMVNMAHAARLPISALSYGPGLKNSITPAKSEAVWRLLFKRQLPGTNPSARAADQGGRKRTDG